jgi:hypothetical protein
VATGHLSAGLVGDDRRDGCRHDPSAVHQRVYIAPSRPLLEVAKQVATAAVIDEGRVALTVGAGWMREGCREYGRLDEPFEIMLALIDEPSVELYQRAEDLGITAVMCAPWMGTMEADLGDVARFRGPIERFAETVIAKLR